MKKINTFRFTGYSYNEATGEVSLRYAFDDVYSFEEKIVFHQPKPSLNADEKSAVEKILFFLHLACGISYYKAFVPQNIIIETGALNQEQAAFFDEFYQKGLGEFSWRNQLDLTDVIRFPYAEKALIEASSPISLTDKTAVPVGGGKDSNVVLEILKSHGENIVCIAQGRPRPIRESIEVSGCPDIEFTRTISPLLIELNKQEGVYNGHVPITGVYAFCLALAAVLYDYDKVAMGNERSANSGNIVRADAFEVNHQWSKSFAFEKSFHDFAQKYMLKNFNYFSMLRPLSELDIASRFAKYTQYHPVFTSCNKAFKINKEQRLERWCGDCDKCRFVFLALAPFMKKQELINFFGTNILEEDKQLNGFTELLGLSSHKPFECVGEISECVAAFYLLAQKDEWKNEFVVRVLYPILDRKYGSETMKKWLEQAFTPANEHLIPERFKDYL